MWLFLFFSFIYLLFIIDERNGFAKTSSTDVNTSWYLFAHSKRQSVSVATVNAIEDAFSRHLSAFVEHGIETSNFFINRACHLSLFPPRVKCPNDTFGLWFSWSLTAPIRNSVSRRTEFCKITMTSGRRNLHSPSPTPLLIFDRWPPPGINFFLFPAFRCH